MGGTCLNRGCIPSKMYIHTADVVEEINNAARFGIKAKIASIDFQSIVKRVRGLVDGDSASIEKYYKTSTNPKLFQGHAVFTGLKELAVDRVVLKADQILIAAGARTTIPPIPGLDAVTYLTSESALRPKQLPKSLTVIGGGYIAAELAHFFGSLGSKITIIEMGPALLGREDQDVSAKFTELFRQKYTVLTGFSVTDVQKKADQYIVKAVNQPKTVTRKTTSAELLVATGVTPNSDYLKVENTGVKVNKFGYIEANDYLETNIKGIFTLGDIRGRYLFKHTANHEAGYAIRNILNPTKMLKVDYTAMPHAVFTSPQIAGVGATEQELIESNTSYKIARYDYKDTGFGQALLEKDGFVKFLYDPKNLTILGCHIIGPQASTLIHEVLIAMKAGDGTLRSITKTIHIHPALAEVVHRAAGNLH